MNRFLVEDALEAIASSTTNDSMVLVAFPRGTSYATFEFLKVHGMTSLTPTGSSWFASGVATYDEDQKTWRFYLVELR